MKIVNIDVAKGEKKFAFLKINRDVKSNKVLRESIIKRGVLNPLIIKISETTFEKNASW